MFFINHLTLTSVVFEWNILRNISGSRTNLTLTSVVFELKVNGILGINVDLTLTSVVFEFEINKDKSDLVF